MNNLIQNLEIIKEQIRGNIELFENQLKTLLVQYHMIENQLEVIKKQNINLQNDIVILTTKPQWIKLTEQLPPPMKNTEQKYSKYVSVKEDDYILHQTLYLEYSSGKWFNDRHQVQENMIPDSWILLE